MWSSASRWKDIIANPKIKGEFASSVSAVFHIVYWWVCVCVCDWVHPKRRYTHVFCIIQWKLERERASCIVKMVLCVDKRATCSCWYLFCHFTTLLLGVVLCVACCVMLFRVCWLKLCSSNAQNQRTRTNEDQRMMKLMMSRAEPPGSDSTRVFKSCWLNVVALRCAFLYFGSAQKRDKCVCRYRNANGLLYGMSSWFYDPESGRAGFPCFFF